MVNSKKLYSILILLVLLSSSILSAQSTKFKQKLSWVEDKNAFDYKVEIRGVDSSYKSLLESDTTYVEVSLPAGKYRYRVYAFDFLGRQASVSEWRDFTVLKAVQPQVVNKEKTVAPVKNEKQVSIPVDVKSIEEDSKVELINKETNQVVEGKLDVKVDDKNQLVASEAVFPLVAEGNWVVKVTNPSGLYTETEEIKVESNITRQQLEDQRRAEEERIAAERRAEEERLAAARRAEEERLAAERKAEEKRLAAERRAEEERLAAERKAEEERLAAERKAEEERLAAERKAEEERLAAERKAEEERIAAERRAEEERLAAERKAEEERVAAERRAEEESIAAERRAEEERLASERKAEEQRLAAERKAEKEEEKAAKKELKKATPPKDFTILAGGGVYLTMFETSPFFTQVGNASSSLIFHDVMPSLDLRMGWLPIKNKVLKTGFEAVATVGEFYFNNDYITAHFPMELFQLNLVVQFRLLNDTFLFALKGGGSIFMIEEIVSYDSRKTFSYLAGTMGPSVQGGASVVWNMTKSFQTELGFDFNHLFIANDRAGYGNLYLVMGVRW